MIDVQTYMILPTNDKVEIEEWLRSVLIEPASLRCTEIEVIDEGGTCRIRHALIDATDAVVVIAGKSIGASRAVVYSDAIITSDSVPVTVRMFGPGSEPPPAAWVLRYREQAA